MNQDKKKIAILVSGRGSNMEAIIRASKDLSYSVAVVVSDRGGIPAIEKAKKTGIPVHVVERKAFANRDAFERQLVDTIKAYHVDLIVLAGFMRILGMTFLSEFENRVLNIHPSLLPAFAGMHAQRQAIEYGVKISGLTIHFVDKGLDSGPVIFQYPVAVDVDDDEESLSAKILKYEHKFYPMVIDIVASGAFEIKGRKVILKRAFRGAKWEL